MPDNSANSLQAYGSNYLAAVCAIQYRLTSAKQARRAVFIIGVRSVSEIGSTKINFMARYAGELEANGGKLMHSGVDQNFLDQWFRAAATDSVPESSSFMVADTLGESTRAAFESAQLCLVTKRLKTREGTLRKEGPAARSLGLAIPPNDSYVSTGPN